MEHNSVQLSITTRHGHLSDESQEKVRQKAEKLNRYFERLTAIELIVDLKDEQAPEVHINVSAEHKHDFVAQTTSDSLMTAVEAAVQKIEQQLRKYKERVQQRNRNHDSRRQDVVTEPDSSES